MSWNSITQPYKFWWNHGNLLRQVCKETLNSWCLSSFNFKHSSHPTRNYTYQLHLNLIPIKGQISINSCNNVSFRLVSRGMTSMKLLATLWKKFARSLIVCGLAVCHQPYFITKVDQKLRFKSSSEGRPKYSWNMMQTF